MGKNNIPNVDGIQTRETPRLPLMQSRAAIQPTSLNEEARTVEIVFTTGERGLRTPFFDEPYFEELEISDTAIRQERLENGLSVIDSHQVYAGIRGVYGISQEYRIENGQLIGTVCFADDEESDTVFNKIRQGILKHVSLGYRIHRMQRVGEEEGIPVYRAIDWSPFELSIVPVPFETTNGVRSDNGQTQYDCEILDEEGNVMFRNRHTLMNTGDTGGGAGAPAAVATTVNTSGDQQGTQQVTEGERAADPAPATAVVAAQPTAPATAVVAAQPTAPAVQTDSVRSYIQAATANGFDQDLALTAFEQGRSLSDFKLDLFDQLAKRSAAAAPNAPLVGERNDHVDAKREDMVAAIRARVTGKYGELTDNQRAFAQMSFIEAARHYMMQNGQRDVYGMSPLQFAGRALHTTSDFPLILENVMNKELLAAYQESPRTFEPFARRTTVNDFREKNTYKTGDAPDLLPLGEHGEYQYGTFSESKESYRVMTYARKLGYTRQMMINDDLSALTRLPTMFGMAGARLESDIVWGLILNYDFITNSAASHTLSDGNPLYGTADTRRNQLTGSGSALDLDTLSNIRGLGRRQRTLDGNFLNVEFNHIAVGTRLETTAQRILNATITPQDVDNVNVFQNAMNLIVEPRIDLATNGQTSQYYFSNMITAIEYAFLAGNEGLFTEVVESTDIDGTTILARHDFGAGFEDYRGTAQATGA